MKTQENKQDIIEYLRNNVGKKPLDVETFVAKISMLIDFMIVDTITDWDEFKRTMPSLDYFEQYVRMFLAKVNPEPKSQPPESKFTREDLRKAFENGKQYADDEPELVRTVGIDNVFDAWYDKIFRFTKK
jgi:hypothetical protein